MQIPTYARLGVIIGTLSLGGVAQAGADELAIRILTSPKLQKSDKESTLVIQTEVGAMCLGSVYSTANPNDRGKLALKNVDREGKATWMWPVDAERSKGSWNLSLQCATHKKDGDMRTTIEFPE